MKIRDPYVIFLLTLIGATSFVVPDALKLACFWVFFIVVLKMIPWPANKLSAQHHIRKITRVAEHSVVVFLLVLWSVGIVGSRAIEEYSPTLLDQAHLESFDSLSRLDIRKRPEVHYLITENQTFNHDLYVAKPVQDRLTLLPVIDVVKHSIRKILAPFGSYSLLFFWVTIGVFLLALFIVNAMIPASNGSSK